MATTYNPYADIKSITDLKGQWDEANKAGDTTKKNQIAATAQAYYDKLKKNDYGGVAEALSANGYSGAKAILDSYAPVSESNVNESNVNNQAYNNSMQSATNKNNTLANYIDSDRKDVQGKYDDIYDYANQNVTKTDEYKSTYNNMMAKYDLSGLQARDNAVASGGSSNGGNIDSYAASNALRQQAALIAQGQQVAHQAGLDAYNSRISNVSNILNNLGVYNSGTYDAMNQTIANDASIAQQYFENDETAKNNDVARKSEIASVTGYTPNEWVIKNDDIYNQFLNSDGSFKKEMENIDIQALINRAKESGDTETAKKLAVVRSRKILGNYGEFGKYANEGDISSISPQITEARRESEQNNDAVLKSLGIESADNRYAIDAEKEINASKNQAEIDKIKAETEGNKELLELQSLLNGGASDKFTSEQTKQVDTVVKTINNAMKNHTSNPNKIDLVNYSVNGIYSFTPTPQANKASYWRDDIIPIIYNSGLTPAERTLLYTQLGFSEEDVIDVYTKKGYLDDNN